MKRPVRYLFIATLALLLVLAGTVGWLAGTESGLQVLCQQLLVRAAPALRIGSVQGRLTGTVTLRELRYADEQLEFSARSLRLDWTPAALLAGVFRVRTLAAEGVHFEQLKAGSSEPVSLPQHFHLPVAVELQDLSLHELVVISAPKAAPLTLDSMALSGAWHGERLEVTRLQLQAPDFAVDGNFTLQTAAGYPLAGGLHWQARPPGYAPLQADAQLTGSLHSLHIEQTLAAPYAAQLRLVLEQPLAALRLDGTVTLQDSDLAAIHGGWPDMHLAGTVTAQGVPDALQLDGSLDLRDPAAGVARLTIRGKRLPEALQIDSMQLVSAGRPVRLDAHGRIGLGDHPVFDLQAQWQALAWPLDGVADYQSRKGSLTLNGTPDHYRVEAHGDLQWKDLLGGELALRAHSATAGNWQIEGASLTGGKARIEASGQVGKVYALDWQVHAARIADLSPGAGGSLQGSGSLTGTLPELAIRARASGRQIDFRTYHVDSLELDGDIRLAPGQPSRLHAAIGPARLDGTRVTRVKLDGSGTPAQHHVHLLAESDRGNAEVDLVGHRDGSTWRFELQQASLGYPSLAPWQLAQPVSGVLAGTRLQLPEHCWNSKTARACLHFDGNAQAYHGAFTLSNLPLDYLAALLPDTVRLDGEVNGHGDFSAGGQQPAVLRLQLDSTPVRLGLPKEDAALQQLFAFAPGQLLVRREGRSMSVRLDLPLATGAGGVELQTGLVAPPGGDWQKAVLNGSMNLVWPDIALARYWLPEASELHGRVDGQVSIEGTVASPRLQGRLALSQGSATLITPGMKLKDVSIELDGQPSGVVQIALTAASGAGTLEGHGQLEPDARKATLHLTGTKFQVMNTPEAKVTASPDLQMEISAERATVTGKIEIPSAHLRPSTPPPSAVNVSPDQVIVVEGGTAESTARFPVHSRVRVVLGEAVDIDGLGLSGKLHGNVLVIDSPGQPATATGELSISDGRYEAYGQDLSITTGRLLYAGNAVTEPGLDIEAVRQPAPDIKVGVRARGSLRAPKFSVFSDPVMPQSEQLSWLVLGRSMQGGASDSQRSALQSAALMLGLNQGESLGKRLGASLGLDEVSVGQAPGADVTQASLLVGKYLNPRLFVSYGIGLFEPVATFSMRYALSSHWKLVGETAAQGSSADLYYEIEQRK